MHVDLLSPDLSLLQRKALAQAITDNLAEVLRLDARQKSRLTIRFETYGPQQLAIGGQLYMGGTRKPLVMLQLSLPPLAEEARDELSGRLIACCAQILELSFDEQRCTRVFFLGPEAPHHVAL